MMSGRLVQPCHECGATLRLSSMALLSTLSALGLILTAILFLVYQQSALLVIAAVLLVILLISMMRTRIESLPPAASPGHSVPPSRDDHPR